MVAGKVVLIGATAIELGDQLSVPRHTILPGPIVQALGFESLVQGRALQRFAALPILAFTLLIVLVAGPLFRVHSWRRGLAAYLASAAAIFLLALGVQSQMPLTIDIVPPVVALGLSFITALASRVDRQDLILLAQGLRIRRRDALMRMVVENSFDGIVTCDENGHIETCNTTATKIFGFDARDIVGQPVSTLIPSLSLKSSDSWRQALDKYRGGPTRVRGLHGSGRAIPVDLVLNELTLQKRPILVAQVRDLTEQEKAESVADLARNRLNDAIQRIPDGLALFDSADNLILCNQIYSDLLLSCGVTIRTGMAYADIIEQLLSADNLSLSDDERNKWLNKRLAYHADPDGSVMLALADGRHIRVSERRTSEGGTVLLYSDVTADKRREANLESARLEAEAANRTKSEFLANMSHELRTPLNAVIGFSEILKGEVLGPLGNETYKGYAGDIFNAGNHLLDVINDILDVSRIEAGEYEIQEEDLDLGKIFDTCLRLIEPQAKKADLTIKCDLPRPAPLLRADERAVKQTLLNLLSNAVKFTPQGGSVTAQVRVRDDGGLEISVKDTGIGIAEEDIPKALSVFGQVDSKLARQFEGTGLGLPLVKSYAELHGGTLIMESLINVGTTVTVDFPADRVQAPLQPQGTA
jgi:PAS domain S-box-containing protein